MVAAGIGAGIVIVILEVLYYKHKGWRKHQKKVDMEQKHDTNA